LEVSKKHKDSLLKVEKFIIVGQRITKR